MAVREALVKERVEALFQLRCPESCCEDRQKEACSGCPGANQRKPVLPLFGNLAGRGPSHRLYFSPKDRLVEQIAFPGLQPLEGGPLGGEVDDGFANNGNGAAEDTTDV